MNPKDKAKELMSNFRPYMYCYIGSGMLTNDYNEKVVLDYAKHCSLICVEQILNNPKNTMRDLSEDLHDEFWNEVKQELNNIKYES